MVYQSSTELKNIARDKMLGNYGTAIGAFLFMRMIILFGMIVTSTIARQNQLIFMAISFLFMMFEGIFVYGELAIYLKISVGMPTSAAEIFSAFKGNADKAIKSRLVLVAIMYGGLILGSIIEFVIDKIDSPYGKLIMAVVWLTIVIVCCYWLIAYSQLLYYLHDFEDISVIEACRRSRRLMKGNMLAYLYLFVSFIPLYLLGVLSMMVGLYFIHPYAKLTFTEFYLDRVRQTQKGVDVAV